MAYFWEVKCSGVAMQRKTRAKACLVEETGAAGDPLNRAGAILAAPKAMIGLLGKRHLRESSNLLKNTLFRDAFSSLIRASFFEQ